MASPAPPLSPDAARRVFLVLSFTRWFPVGLVAGIMTLWQLERGLSIAQAASAGAVQGIVVVLLELPTSGFADTFGRRPVFVVSTLFQVLGCVSLLFAHSVATFALTAALFGVFRALDSGPLEAWFVDTVHLSEPGTDVDRTLATQGTIVGAGMAAGAVLSGALVWWHPVTSRSALWLPVAVYGALAVVHVVITALLMHEPRPLVAPGAGGWARARACVADAPRVVRAGLTLVTRGAVLRLLIVAEVSWAAAMVVFEMLQPVRLAELLGGKEAAGAWMGPIAAGAWAVFGIGSALAGRTSAHLGVARSAMLGRLLNGLGAVVMGLSAGPGALVAAYLFTYSMHGFAGPMHAALLHREARADTRATVMSLNSMAGSLAYTAAAPVLGWLALRAGTPVAMVVGGIGGVLGVLCYVPARRAELRTARGLTTAGRGLDYGPNPRHPATEPRGQ